MNVRTAVLLAAVSALSATAGPAFGYWSQPVEVDVSLRAGQVGTPVKLATLRGGEHGDSVTVRWQAPATSAVPLTGYRLERSDVGSGADAALPDWSSVTAAPTCDQTGECTVVDHAAPPVAFYRVSSQGGTWTSPPSEGALSAVVAGVERRPSAPSATSAPRETSAPSVSDAASPPTQTADKSTTDEGCAGAQDWDFTIPDVAAQRGMHRATVSFSSPIGTAAQLITDTGATDLSSTPDGMVTLTPSELQSEVVLRICPEPVDGSPPDSAWLLLDG